MFLLKSMGTTLKLLRPLVDGGEYRRCKIAQVVKNEFFTVNVHRVYRCLIAVEHIWVVRGVARHGVDKCMHKNAVE